MGLNPRYRLTSEPKQCKMISHQQCINSMVFYLKPSVHMDLVILKKAANAVHEFHKLSQEITPKYFASYFDWLHRFICQRHQTESVEMIGS